jgi:hypothetical protein
MMLRTAITAQNKSIDRLNLLFGDATILFTLVGSAACREYGLSRPANDLDFVVNGYQHAMNILTRSGGFALESCNPANTNCTQVDLKTGVKIDFLMSGTRINDRVWLNGIHYSDPLPIPEATGFGDIAPLPTLITMKVNVLTSGLDTLRLGANTGGRSLEEVRKDIADVTELIAVNRLSRHLSLGSDVLQRHYEKIFDRKLLV